MLGEVFWKLKISKISTRKYFSSELFFQNSYIFSNNSHRLCVVVRSLAARSVHYHIWYVCIPQITQIPQIFQIPTSNTLNTKIPQNTSNTTNSSNTSNSSNSSNTSEAERAKRASSGQSERSEAL